MPRIKDGSERNGIAYKYEMLVVEFLESADMDYKKFCKERGINHREFGTVLSRLGIIKIHRDFSRKALDKAKENLKKRLETFYLRMESSQVEMWDKTSEHTKKLLNGKELTPKQLNELTSVIERVLKAYRLMEGKSTENSEKKVVNLHLAAVQIVDSLKNGTVIESSPDNRE